MIATGSIGAAVQGLGACSTSGDELTELLAGITGTEVVSAGQLGSNLSVPGAALFPEAPAEGGVHPRLVPSPGFTGLTLGASVAVYLLPWSGEEQVAWVG